MGFSFTFSTGKDVTINFLDGVCQVAQKSADIDGLSNCLLWASYQVPELKADVLEGLSQISPQLTIFSLFFSPSFMSLIVHLIGVVLVWLLLHVFYSLIPNK